MTETGKRIGVDVGGSHVTAAIIDINDPGRKAFYPVRKDINAMDTASNIIESIASCIKQVMVNEAAIDAIGIAFPGPFDYAKGFSAIANVGGKFEQLFGLRVKQALQDKTGLSNIPFRFSNDAHCFAVGAYSKYGLKSKRTILLTLGTGFGSAFMENGALLNHHPAIPLTGVLYNQHFLNSQADDYFSTRWFLNEYKLRTGKKISSVKVLAESNTDIALTVFTQFGLNLGAFLLPWLKQFECDELVIGGNISNACSLFKRSFNEQLGQLSKTVNVIFCSDTESCILTGAALIAGESNSAGNGDHNFKTNRKTLQPLLPVTVSPANKTGYDIFPSYKSGSAVYTGFNTLAKEICNEKTVIIDGFGGVLWELFREQLAAALYGLNKKVFWYDINACLKAPGEINGMLEDSLNGDDPVFGKKYIGNLVDFFDKQLLAILQPDPAVLCILYGTGAALCNWKGPLIYMDVPKNEIQYRMRAGSIMNTGSNCLFAVNQMYKRLYFADWPVLNKHKQQLLPQIDYIVDEQRIHEITWMHGDDFRNTLGEMLEHPFRARPWFEAGIWGGNWMKQHITGLNKAELNYAWSFELITPENGIVIEGARQLLEVSFDFLLYCNHKKLLGKAAARFGTEFPIRFDFLDTCDGGNLSIQCHPRTRYIRENFGENFTQDETYYILDCETDANVYLGFQQDIDPAEFKTALLDAQNSGTELPVEKYIQKLPAHKHDLFLIPNGTIHASGKNNLVLEISSTPYIFTFKMYDWLRLDQNGQSRPINIEHAFKNLYFDRKGDLVKEQLVAKPQVIREWNGGRQLKLPTHEEHFYTVDRYEFTGSVLVETNEQCHICMLVEGTTIEVMVEDTTACFCYAETFVVPAGVRRYQLNQQGDQQAFVVVAYVKENCC